MISYWKEIIKMELKLTLKDIQNFKPTEEMKEATKKVFSNMANETYC